MSPYRRNATTQPVLTAAAATAKAKRQALMRNVRARRAQRYKRAVADWVQDGLLIWGSTFKDRYLSKQSSSVR
jgi:hypothetical protein